jgi:hypothetical protein
MRGRPGKIASLKSLWWPARTWRYLDDGGAAGGSGGAGAAASAAGAGQAAASGSAGAGGGSAAPAGPVNADGTFAPGWLQRTGMDPALATNKTLVAVKSVADLATMFANQEKLLGRKGQIVPTDPSDQAGWDAWFKTAGWPAEGPDKYPAIPLPAGQQADDTFQAADKTLRGWAHELRLTAAQYKGLTERILSHNAAEDRAEAAAATQAAQAREAALRTKWGPRYETSVQLANSAMAAAAAQAGLNQADCTALQQVLAATPAFQEIMAAFGSMISPDRLHIDAGSGRPDLGGLERRIAELETSPEYRDPKHARNRMVTEQVLALRQQLLHAKGKGK